MQKLVKSQDTETTKSVQALHSCSINSHIHTHKNTPTTPDSVKISLKEMERCC